MTVTLCVLLWARAAHESDVIAYEDQLHPQWARVTSATVGTVNTEPAIVFELDGRLLAVMVPEFDGDRITAFHAVANPEKLAFLARQTI